MHFQPTNFHLFWVRNSYPIEKSNWTEFICVWRRRILKWANVLKLLSIRICSLPDSSFQQKSLQNTQLQNRELENICNRSKFSRLALNYPHRELTHHFHVSITNGEKQAYINNYLCPTACIDQVVLFKKKEEIIIKKIQVNGYS